MTTSDPVVYRSTNPAVIDAYETAIAERTEFHRRVDAFIAQHSGGRQPMFRTGFGRERFAGFVAPVADDDNPPDGWRVDRGEGLLVPDRRRTAGKVLAGEVEALGSWQRPALPGMPAEVWDGPRVRWPGMEHHAGTVYVRWSAEPVPAPDGDLWERSPLSAYFAAREAEGVPVDA